MRFLLLLILMVVPQIAAAQGAFRIAANGCVKPGQALTISGAFTPRPAGDVVLNTAPRPTALRVQGWSSRQIRVGLPRTGLTAGATLSLLWAVPGSAQQTLGRIQICGGAAAPQAQKTAPNRTRAPRDVVPAPDGSPEYTVIVASGQANAATTALQGQGATVLRTRNLPALGQRVLVFAFPGGLTLAQARAALVAAAPTAEIDLHHIYGLAAGPRLYAAAMIGDDPGGGTCALRRAVRVGLVDGPVNPAHPALAGVSLSRKSVLGAGERAGGGDHGTAVAGLLAGRATKNGLGGFAPGAQVFAAQAFSVTKGRTGARLENVAAGIDWLAGQKVKLVNLSISGSTNRAFARLLAVARGRGVVMVAAVGNERTSKPRYPAASADVIAVTAVDAAGKIYRQANSGAHVEFAAPGVDVYAAKGKSGGYHSGTSFAAPIVTAILARQAAGGGLTLDKARSVLKRQVRDLGAVGRDVKFGWGLVQTNGC